MITLPSFPRLIPSVRRQFEAARSYSESLRSWSGQATADVQLRKLQGVWSDCISDVPYYRNLVNRGKAPDEINSWDDFRKLPALDRPTLKENASAFIRDSGPPDGTVSTAGSTGQPVKLGTWRHEGEPIRVAKLVPWVRLGYTLDSRVYLIWGHAHLLGTSWRRYVNHAIRKAKDCALGYTRVDAYTMNAAKCEKIAREIIQLRPVGLIGYAAVLDLLARQTTPFHDQLRAAGLRFVMSCAEPPPREDTFALLRRIFGCPILQEFGGVDFGHVAFKVDDEPFQVFPDMNILEADPGSDEQGGRAALVTTLYPRYTPLIRYRQGDLLRGVRQQEHGHVFEFTELCGRINDTIRLDDGTSIHSVALVHCFKDEDSIFNVQLVLTNQGPVFSLVARGPLADAEERRVRHRLAQIHPSLSRARFEIVSDLQTNRAGKRRWFIDQRSNLGAGLSGVKAEVRAISPTSASRGCR
jgi:phenylacetate-CoA ligase